MVRELFAAASIAALVAAPSLAHAWGALSVSEDGEHYGYSYDYDSEAAAKKRARSECGGCDWVVTFRNTCAAYAQAESGHWGWSKGETRQAAEKGARRQCRGAGGNSCEVLVWGCDTK